MPVGTLSRSYLDLWFPGQQRGSRPVHKLWRLKLINSFIFMPAASLSQDKEEVPSAEQEQHTHKSLSMASFNTPTRAR